MREAFKFYRSYYECFKMCKNDKEKAQFIEAILEKQFHNIEPEGLNDTPKMLYISQKHSIDKQVKGYEDRVGEPLTTPLAKGTVKPLAKGTGHTPTEQEEEQEKEKEQEKEEVVPSKKQVLDYFNERSNNHKYAIADAESFYYYWDALKWKDKKTKKDVVWKSRAATWFNKSREDGKYETKRKMIYESPC